MEGEARLRETGVRLSLMPLLTQTTTKGTTPITEHLMKNAEDRGELTDSWIMHSKQRRTPGKMNEARRVGGVNV